MFQLFKRFMQPNCISKTTARTTSKISEYTARTKFSSCSQIAFHRLLQELQQDFRLESNVSARKLLQSDYQAKFHSGVAHCKDFRVQYKQPTGFINKIKVIQTWGIEYYKEQTNQTSLYRLSRGVALSYL